MAKVNFCLAWWTFSLFFFQMSREVITAIPTTDQVDLVDDVTETSPFIAEFRLTTQPITTPTTQAPAPFSAAASTLSENICPQYLNRNRLIPCWIWGKESDSFPTSACYCFSRYTDSWQIANETCSQGNMSLIFIESTAEDAYLKQQVYYLPELHGYAYWTSGIFNDTADAWQWASTGKLIDFSKLSSYYDKRTESVFLKSKCLLSYHRQDSFKGFVPRFCASYGYRFICKRELSI